MTLFQAIDRAVHSMTMIEIAVALANSTLVIAFMLAACLLLMRRTR